jgi:hypothetical protein
VPNRHWRTNRGTNLDATRGWVVNATLRPLWAPRKETRYPLQRRLGGPRGRSELVRIISPQRGLNSRPPRSWRVATPTTLHQLLFRCFVLHKTVGGVAPTQAVRMASTTAFEGQIFKIYKSGIQSYDRLISIINWHRNSWTFHNKLAPSFIEYGSKSTGSRTWRITYSQHLQE